MLRVLATVAAFIGVVALIMALAACSNENDIEAKSPPEIPVEDGSAPASDGVSSASSGENSGEASDDNDSGGNGKSDDVNGNNGNGGGSSQPASQDGVASFANPNPDGNGITLNSAPNEALKDANPLNVVTWNTPPTMGLWELSAEGVVEDGAALFDPVNGEGAPFLLYYKGHDDPMVAILPDLGPMQIWQTDLTVSPADMEIEGGKFSFRAYSPLFADDPSNLELRVYGYDTNGDPAILAIADLVGQ